MKTKTIYHLTAIIIIALCVFSIPFIGNVGVKASGQNLSSFEDISEIFSDDFNSCDLNTEVWSFVDPVGDSTYGMTGTFSDDARLEIFVPSGVKHSLSESNTYAPRVMQTVSNINFEVEVKFESTVSAQYQGQGILIEQTPNTNFLRLEFYADGANIHLYAASLIDSTLTPINDVVIASAGKAPLYMKVSRSGTSWIQSYSFDGSTWYEGANFSHTITVTAVGVYALNTGDNPPAHTSLVDYFFNTASPISPEDGARNNLNLSTNGSGTVSASPSPPYVCGTPVNLTANPAAGWKFDNWSGDLSGSTNPTSVIMNGSKSITANFSQVNYTLMVNTVGSGTVTKNPNKATYQYGDVVALTATPDLTWRFEGWSGDITSEENPVELTILGNTDVTATFVTFRHYLPLVIKSQ